MTIMFAATAGGGTAVRVETECTEMVFFGNVFTSKLLDRIPFGTLKEDFEAFLGGLGEEVGNVQACFVIYPARGDRVTVEGMNNLSGFKWVNLSDAFSVWTMSEEDRLTELLNSVVEILIQEEGEQENEEEL